MFQALVFASDAIKSSRFQLHDFNFEGFQANWVKWASFSPKEKWKHKFQQPAAISRSQIMSTKWRVMWIGKGRGHEELEGFLSGRGATTAVLSLSAWWKLSCILLVLDQGFKTQIRLMDKFLHQFERFETHTQNLRKWDVDVDYIINRLTCSSPSTKCSKQSMVSSSWPQQ